ncbi:hypothetical protein F4778DRAFT_766034 [Xylariomycetidae sp. FL2044]|nr:hypothetical protein F4778DRAFT_766034 [Xylariomycetidae sp. FL2044]
MGSQFNSADDLPDAGSPSLVLTSPTDSEKRQTWIRNHVEWGGALNLEQYLEREPYLTTIPLSANGGMTHWILTTTTTDSVPGAEQQQQRPILASCETIRKPVLVASPDDGSVAEATGYGIASVYTCPELRGRKYATRMLQELGTTLRTWQSEQRGGQDAAFSALWSDIGKAFYAKLGWPAYPSSHVEFVVPASSSLSNGNATDTAEAAAATKTTPVTYKNLAQLCAKDTSLLREKLARAARETGHTCVSFVPAYEAMLWHLRRDDFIASTLYPSSATTTSNSYKGAIAGSDGSRVWAVWARNYYSANPGAREKNKLYILRLVIEDESPAAEAGNAVAFAAVLGAAMRGAREWGLGVIEMWNPTPAIKGLVEKGAAGGGVEWRWVDRGADSIPSLMWYGEKKEKVEWVANEKFCWC